MKGYWLVLLVILLSLALAACGGQGANRQQKKPQAPAEEAAEAPAEEPAAEEPAAEPARSGPGTHWLGRQPRLPQSRSGSFIRGLYTL